MNRKTKSNYFFIILLLSIVSSLSIGFDTILRQNKKTTTTNAQISQENIIIQKEIPNNTNITNEKTFKKNEKKEYKPSFIIPSIKVNPLKVNKKKLEIKKIKNKYTKVIKKDSNNLNINENKNEEFDKSENNDNKVKNKPDKNMSQNDKIKNFQNKYKKNTNNYNERSQDYETYEEIEETEEIDEVDEIEEEEEIEEKYINEEQDYSEDETTYNFDDYIYTIRYFIASNPILNRIHGSFGFDYEKQTFKDKSSTSKNSKKSKFLKLSYSDYIYSYNLINYKINTKLLDSKSKNKGNTSENEDNEYELNVNFLAKTFMPFSIKTNQQSSPSISYNDDGIVQSTSNSNNKQLSGSFSYDNLSLSYAFSKNNSNSNSKDTFLNKKSDSTSYSLSKSLAGINYKLSYIITDIENDLYNIFYNKEIITNENTNLDIRGKSFTFNIKNDLLNSKNDFDIISDKKENDTSMNIYINPSNDFTIRANVNINKDDILFSENNNANVSVYYQYNKNLNFNLSSYFNEFKNNEIINKSINNNINTNYSLSKLLNLSHTISYSPSQNEDKTLNKSSETKSLSNAISLSYKKELNKKTVLGTGISLNKTSDEYDDSKESSSSYSVFSSLRYSLNRNTILNFLSRYEDFKTTSSDDSNELTLKASLIKNILFNLRYSSDLDYSIRNTIAKDSTSNSLKENIINFDNKITYVYSVDIRGKITSDIGIKYYNYTDNLKKESYITPNISSTLRYNLLRTLVFTLKAKVNQDKKNDILNYTTTSQLKYKYRKINISLDAQYFGQKEDENKTSTTNILLSFSRSF